MTCEIDKADDLGCALADLVPAHLLPLGSGHHVLRVDLGVRGRNDRLTRW
jgi:hypothetical protein